MGHPWMGQQLKLLKLYQEKGLDWVLAEVNKVPGAPTRTRAGTKRQASSMGYARAKPDPLTTTPQIDEAIRRAYASGKFGAAKRCGIACNRPVWWIVDRAKQLKLRPIKAQTSRAWTERERGIVRNAAHLPLGEIKARLKAIGSKRSAGMISDFIQRQGIEAKRDRPLSGSQVANLLGVDGSTVGTLISRGLLIAKRSGGPVDVASSRQYLIEPVDIARFAIKYPTVINLRKVDQVWFIDLLAHYAEPAQRDMNRDRAVRVAQMVRENPDLAPERVESLFEISPEAAKELIARARRDTMREAA